MADVTITADYSDLKTLSEWLSKTDQKVKVLTKTAENNYQTFKKQKTELDNVKRSIDPLYNATVAFEQKLAILNRELKKENPAEYARNLKLLSDQARRAGIQVDNLGNVVGMNNKSTRQMELGFQQAGYQIQDFIVQVQSGTNPLIAFSQQGSQLAGFFAGPWGAAIGLGIAALSSFAMAFMAASEDSKKSADRVSETMDSLKSDIEALELDNLKIGFKTDKDSVAKAKREILTASLEIAKIQQESSPVLGLGRGSAAAAAMWKQDQKERADAQQDIIDSLEEQLAVLDAQEEAQRMLNGHLSTAKGLVTNEADERARHKAILDQINATENDRKAIFHALAGESESVSKYMDESFQAGLKLSNLDMATPISDAAVAAQVLADKLGISVGLAAEIGKIGGMTPEESKIYSGVKSGALPPAALNSIGMGQTGFSMEGFSSPIQWMGLPPNPTTPRKKSGGGGGKSQTQEEYIQQLIREDEQKRKLIGLTDEETSASENEFKVREKLRDLKGSVTEEEIQSTLRQMDATQKLIEQEKQREAMIKSVASTVESAFMSMVDGSKSVSEAFKGMIRDILLDVYRQNVVSPIGDMVSGALKGLFMANGGAFKNGVQMFADGGVVGSPTLFGHKGGLGMMGEAGPEAIMPLKRGKNGKLGVQMDGANSGAIAVNNNITVTGSDAAMVRAEVAKMIPQITNATKAAVIDARLRGGQMKAAFR